METVFYEIKRETSKYNKYMKWHVSMFREDKSLLSSEHFKTQKEAISSIDRAKWRGQRGFPIGDKLFYTNYEEVFNG